MVSFKQKTWVTMREVYLCSSRGPGWLHSATGRWQSSQTWCWTPGPGNTSPAEEHQQESMIILCYIIGIGFRQQQDICTLSGVKLMYFCKWAVAEHEYKKNDNVGILNCTVWGRPHSGTNVLLRYEACRPLLCLVSRFSSVFRRA